MLRKKSFNLLEELWILKGLLIFQRSKTMVSDHKAAYFM